MILEKVCLTCRVSPSYKIYTSLQIVIFHMADPLSRALETRGLMSDKEYLGIWKSSKDFPRDKDAHRDFDRDNGEQESRTLLSRSPSGKLMLSLS